MENDLVSTIKSRLDSMGMSQAQFAKEVGATPAQMSIFLRGKGSLSVNSINKCLTLLGVNLTLYTKRTEMAKEVASILLDKNVSSIENWTKNDLASFTQKRDILLLFDVKSKEEYAAIEESRLIDIESTFPYFKSLVSYYMVLRKDKKDKPTASEAIKALNAMSMSKYFGAIAAAAASVAAASTAAASIAPFIQIGARFLFSKTLDHKEPSLITKSLDYIEEKAEKQ